MKFDYCETPSHPGIRSNDTNNDFNSNPIETRPRETVHVDFPSVLVTVLRPLSSESGSLGKINNENANDAKPTFFGIKQPGQENSTPFNQTQRSESTLPNNQDAKQLAPENSTPANQTQRSEATSPNKQDNASNSGDISSSTNQSNRSNNEKPLMDSTTEMANPYRRPYLPFPSIDGPSYSETYPIVAGNDGNKKKSKKDKKDGKANIPKDRIELDDIVIESRPSRLTPQIAKKIVDAVANDTNFEIDNIKGNYYERIFTWFGGPYSGGIRNFSFTLLDAIVKLQNAPFVIISSELAFDKPILYDEDAPEVGKLLCTGIAGGAIKAIEKQPKVLEQLTKLDIADRVISGVSHTAVLVEIGDRKYVFDWHQSLEADNPRIHTYENWLKGNDDKGVFYNEIKNNTFWGKYFLKYQ